MEATIQSTNRAINIDINISINVDSLKAIIQRGWQAIKQRVLQATNKRINVGAWSLPRLYRKELRLARAVARAINAHPTISNICLWLMGVGIMVEIFLFA
jgi:hypothetical protein